MTFAFDPKSDLPLVLGGNVFGWTADRADAFAVLDAFTDAGGTQIDTADVYSAWIPGNSGGESETILGEWIASRNNRDRVFLGTKVGALGDLANLKADTIAQAVDDSLRRLQTDYIDLYWAHRDDADTPQEETAAAFDALVKAGKVRNLGASNFSPERLASALDVAKAAGLTGYVAVQPHYNLLETSEYEGGVGKVAEQHGLACWPYYGLASGFLTGKYRPGTDVDSARSGSVTKYFDDRGWRTISTLDAIAAKHGASVSAVALAWLAQQSTVLAPIASARNSEQLTALLDLRGLELSEEELRDLREAAA
ncbi:MAG: aldo/keto reductase [Frankiales bacterium]|nr:aldo/keto reductase [Frankiales bacterium]